MITISQTLGALLPPVIISVVTLGVLALLRLVTPSVRWNRRFKRDADIYSALPEGKEKEMWAASVTAQGERLRLYREDLSIADQLVAWYAFLALAGSVVALGWDSTHGWVGVNELTKGEVALAIPGALILAINWAFALFVSVRLILGRSTALRSGSGGHYPKYDTLRRIERRRKLKRASIELRLAHVQANDRETGG